MNEVNQLVPISMKEYLRKVEGSKAKKAEVKASLQAAVKDKKKGVTCIICDQPIWAIGAGTMDQNMCFTCMTGEADSPEDYEIDTVCP